MKKIVSTMFKYGAIFTAVNVALADGNVPNNGKADGSVPSDGMNLGLGFPTPVNFMSDDNGVDVVSDSDSGFEPIDAQDLSDMVRNLRDLQSFRSFVENYGPSFEDRDLYLLLQNPSESFNRDCLVGLLNAPEDRDLTDVIQNLENPENFRCFVDLLGSHFYRRALIDERIRQRREHLDL